MISNQALEKARTVAPGYDVYAPTGDYLASWDDKGQQHLKNADAAFLGWCKKRHERNPLREPCQHGTPDAFCHDPILPRAPYSATRQLLAPPHTPTPEPSRIGKAYAR